MFNIVSLLTLIWKLAISKITTQQVYPYLTQSLDRWLSVIALLEQPLLILFSLVGVPSVD